MDRSKRIHKTHLYLQIAYLISLRAKCRRGSVGCIVVKDKRIISSGCNGPISSCPDEFCKCPENYPCGDRESVHAEMNAIAFASKEGLEIRGSTLYTTLSPCFNCAKLIKTSGITEVIFWKPYKDTSPIEFLKEHDIKISQYSGELQEYSDTDL